MTEDEFTEKTTEEIEEEELQGYASELESDESDEEIEEEQEENNSEVGLITVPSNVYSEPTSETPLDDGDVLDADCDIEEQVLNPNRKLYSNMADRDGFNRKLPIVDDFSNYTEYRRHNYTNEYENTNLSKWEIFKRKIMFWNYGTLDIYDWNEERNVPVLWRKRLINLAKVPKHAVEVTNRKRHFAVNYIPPKYRSFKDINHGSATTLFHAKTDFAYFDSSNIVKGEIGEPFDLKKWLIIGGVGIVALFCLWPIFMG